MHLISRVDKDDVVIYHWPHHDVIQLVQHQSVINVTIEIATGWAVVQPPSLTASYCSICMGCLDPTTTSMPAPATYTSGRLCTQVYVQQQCHSRVIVKRISCCYMALATQWHATRF
jgi:hypothetical protein